MRVRPPRETGELAALLVAIHRKVLRPKVAVADVVRIEEEARGQRVVRSLDRLRPEESSRRRGEAAVRDIFHTSSSRAPVPHVEVEQLLWVL